MLFDRLANYLFTSSTTNTNQTNGQETATQQQNNPQQPTGAGVNAGASNTSANLPTAAPATSVAAEAAPLSPNATAASVPATPPHPIPIAQAIRTNLEGRWSRLDAKLRKFALIGGCIVSVALALLYGPVIFYLLILTVGGTALALYPEKIEEWFDSHQWALGLAAFGTLIHGPLGFIAGAWVGHFIENKINRAAAVASSLNETVRGYTTSVSAVRNAPANLWQSVTNGVSNGLQGARNRASAMSTSVMNTFRNMRTATPVPGDESDVEDNEQAAAADNPVQAEGAPAAAADMRVQAENAAAPAADAPQAVNPPLVNAAPAPQPAVNSEPTTSFWQRVWSRKSVSAPAENTAKDTTPVATQNTQATQEAARTVPQNTTPSQASSKVTIATPSPKQTTRLTKKRVVPSLTSSDTVSTVVVAEQAAPTTSEMPVATRTRNKQQTKKRVPPAKSTKNSKVTATKNTTNQSDADAADKQKNGVQEQAEIVQLAAPRVVAVQNDQAPAPFVVNNPIPAPVAVDMDLRDEPELNHPEAEQAPLQELQQPVQAQQPVDALAPIPEEQEPLPSRWQRFKNFWHDFNEAGADVIDAFGGITSEDSDDEEDIRAQALAAPAPNNVVQFDAARQNNVGLREEPELDPDQNQQQAPVASRSSWLPRLW